MSYCVNCGVELDETLKQCPLCNTWVINPKAVPNLDAVPPFPTQRGQVDSVKRKDLAIFLTIVLISTAATCFLLNLLIFNFSAWSIPIIGICALLWVFAIPAIIYTKMSLYWSLFLDGIAVGAYLYLLTNLTADNDWFFILALPITALVTLLIEVLLFLLLHFRISFLTTAVYLFAELAILCAGLELLIDHFLSGELSLSWSAIVITVCVIIIIALLTVLSRSRLRNAVRRRLHF